MGIFDKGKKSRGGGGGGAPQVIQPEMPQHPLLRDGLIPAATGRLNASMPWLQSGQRTMDYFNDPQFNSAPMQTPQFNQQQFSQQFGQQQATAKHWQNNLDSFFPSPWGTMLSYAGENAYKTPTGGGQPPGGGMGGPSGGGFGGPGGATPPGFNAQPPGGPGGQPGLERYISRDPQSGGVQGGFFESADQWAAYNGFQQPQQNMFSIPSPQATPQAPIATESPGQFPDLRTGGGVTPQAMGPQLRTGGGVTPQAMGPQIPRNF